LRALLLLLPIICACHIAVPKSKPVPIQAPIILYNHPLKLFISQPGNNQNSGVLVVYATGDGGWYDLDREIFEWISKWNYPAVGFSSKDYLKNLGSVSDTTTPRNLAQDFDAIIQFAEQKLNISPATPIVLVGLSRGAGLAVVAAGEGALDSKLAGVLAIALTKEEEYVVHYKHGGNPSSGKSKNELVQIETYEYLPRIKSVPVVVIQSTHDNYLPAEDARALFGPDTSLKKLLPIEAQNHSFYGGRPDLFAKTEAALSWIYRIGVKSDISR
jgi:pimeloyl-ACP methyl ester carboxylesterase